MLSFGGFAASAQDGYHVLISGLPEKIQIVPGVYEFFGEITDGPDAEKGCYALSINEALAGAVKDSVARGISQSLFGPKFENLVKDMAVSDYQKKRKEIEKSVEDSISHAKFLSGDWFRLKKTLKDEQKNTVDYVTELRTITDRMKLRCIYIYSYQNAYEFNRSENSPQKTVGKPPYKSDNAHKFEQPDQR